MAPPFFSYMCGYFIVLHSKLNKFRFSLLYRGLLLLGDCTSNATSQSVHAHLTSRFTLLIVIKFFRRGRFHLSWTVFNFISFPLSSNTYTHTHILVEKESVKCVGCCHFVAKARIQAPASSTLDVLVVATERFTQKKASVESVKSMPPAVPATKTQGLKGQEPVVPSLNSQAVFSPVSEGLSPWFRKLDEKRLVFYYVNSITLKSVWKVRFILTCSCSPSVDVILFTGTCRGMARIAEGRIMNSYLLIFCTAS